MGEPPFPVLPDEPVNHHLPLAVINDHQVIALTQQSFAAVPPVEHHFSSSKVATFWAKLPQSESVQHLREFACNVRRVKTCMVCQFQGRVQIFWQQGRECTVTRKLKHVSTCTWSVPPNSLFYWLSHVFFFSLFLSLLFTPYSLTSGIHSQH